MTVFSVILVFVGMCALAGYVYHIMYRKQVPKPLPGPPDPANTAEMVALQAARAEISQLTVRADSEPDNAMLANEIAAKCLAISDARTALVYATRAVMAQRDAIYLNNLGRAHLALANIDAAQQAFQAAHAMEPEDPGYWYNLAQALRLCGEFQASEDALAALLEAHPEHTAARAELGLLLHNRKRDADAVKYMERLVADYPEVKRYRLTLIQILCDSGHFSVARPHLQWLQERGETVHVAAHNGAYSVTVNGRELYEGLLA